MIDKDENKKGIVYDSFSNSYCLIPDELQELYDEYDKLQEMINNFYLESDEYIKNLTLSR